MPGFIVYSWCSAVYQWFRDKSGVCCVASRSGSDKCMCNNKHTRSCCSRHARIPRGLCRRMPYGSFRDLNGVLCGYKIMLMPNPLETVSICKIFHRLEMYSQAKSQVLLHRQGIWRKFSGQWSCLCRNNNTVLWNVTRLGLFELLPQCRGVVAYARMRLY